MIYTVTEEKVENSATVDNQGIFVQLNLSFFITKASSERVELFKCLVINGEEIRGIVR